MPTRKREHWYAALLGVTLRIAPRQTRHLDRQAGSAIVVPS